MNPYLRAYAEYEKADRGVTWTDALDYHLQHGAVVATPDFFAMLRPVELFWSDEEHISLDNVSPHSDVWNIWILAGDLQAALSMACKHGITWASYQRHGWSRVRRTPISQMLKTFSSMHYLSLIHI